MKNKSDNLLALDTYRPEKFLDALIRKLKLRSDADLARAVLLQASVISRIRKKTIPVSAQNLLDFHDASGISIKKLRKMMGDSRKFFR